MSIVLSVDSGAKTPVLCIGGASEAPARFERGSGWPHPGHVPPLAFSRYLNSLGLTDAEGRLFLTDPEPYRYVELTDNRFHEVRQGDTLHQLAESYFPNVKDAANLWWAIAWFQPDPIHDPTIALEPGRILVIPSERTLQERILSSSRAQA